MPIDQDFRVALDVVEKITGAPAFRELSADPISAASQADPIAALRERGVDVPPEVFLLVAKRRHPTQIEWDREWRSGGMEWQFFVNAGAKRFRIVHICDPWAREIPAAAIQPHGHGHAVGWNGEQVSRDPLQLGGHGHGTTNEENDLGDTEHENGQEPDASNATPASTTVKDVVCGMDVDPATAPARAEYRGQTYYFCAPGCKVRFEREPAKYVSA